MTEAAIEAAAACAGARPGSAEDDERELAALEAGYGGRDGYEIGYDRDEWFAWPLGPGREALRAPSARDLRVLLAAACGRVLFVWDAVPVGPCSRSGAHEGDGAQEAALEAAGAALLDTPDVIAVLVREEDGGLRTGRTWTGRRDGAGGVAWSGAAPQGSLEEELRAWLDAHPGAEVHQAGDGWLGSCPLGTTRLACGPVPLGGLLAAMAALAAAAAECLAIEADWPGWLAWAAGGRWTASRDCGGQVATVSAGGPGGLRDAIAREAGKAAAR